MKSKPRVRRKKASPAKKAPANKKPARKRAPAKAAPRNEFKPGAGISQRDLAAMLSEAWGVTVTKGQVAGWKDKGHTVTDPEILFDELRQQSRPPAFVTAGAGGGATVGELQIALLIERIKKTAAEASIKEFEAEAAAGRYMLTADAHAAGYALAGAHRQTLTALPEILPEMLVGLGAGAMKKKLRAHVRTLLEAAEKTALDFPAESSERLS